MRGRVVRHGSTATDFPVQFEWLGRVNGLLPKRGTTLLNSGHFQPIRG
jgi:hypothetical protein